MRKRPYAPVEGVSNIELFYDLIFVYCISVITSLMHHVDGAFPDLETWVIYLFTFLVVLQVWVYTTLLINRYGDRSISDSVCLFINMFLLYFMASGINDQWQSSFFTFNMSWALILVNLLVHWGLKYVRYSNLDADDKKIIFRTMGAIATQLVIVAVSLFFPVDIGQWIAVAALVVGMLLWSQAKVYALKPPNFEHLAERCSLLIIVTFGEMVVAISSYMTTTSGLLYPIFVFALAVGLFLIYIYEHDNMLDHHHKSDGMGFMTVHSWIVVVLGNLILALEFMPNPEFDFLPKSIYLAVCLVAYLLTSFLLVRYNKPEFHFSAAYVVGRLSVCAAIVAIALLTNFNPTVNLICDTVAVYAALGYEVYLHRGRTALVAMARDLGYTDEQLVEMGYTFCTAEGRRKIRAAAAEMAGENMRRPAIEASTDKSGE